MSDPAEPPSIEVQFVASSQHYHPMVDDIKHWVAIALESENQGLTIRIVDEEEITVLNHQYRYKNTSTNVLSFPSDYPAELNLSYLGDVIICAQVVNFEAAIQDKIVDDHWAHMVIHGVLHLRGYDHISSDKAMVMEPLEARLLETISIENPYYE